MRVIFSLGWVFAASAALAQMVLPPGPPAVRNEPFTALSTGITYQKLANGTTIEHRGASQMARDSAGRTWTKTPVDYDPLQPKHPDWFRITVYDPETRLKMSWCTCGKVVTVNHFGEPRRLPPEHVPGAEGMDAYLGPAGARLKFHGEVLPPQTIMGVETRGSKAVRTVPAGTDGNDHDLVTTIQSWYSPELHLALVTIIDDPVKGLTKHEFEDLKRVEPDPAIFQIPPGYLVRDAAP